MAEPTARHLSLPSGLLELCALLGASQDSLRGLEQVAQKRGVKSVSSLAPEVLSVFVPPFTTKDDGQVAGASCTLGKARRRSFRKKREKPRIESWKSHPGDSKGPDSEDVTIPGGVDLLALPQLCFPGGVCVASEPKEDYIHFLVLTDVCGNRTYGVVAQYYRPLHDEYCFYNGKTHWEPSVSSARRFVPSAVCVVSRFPYYNSLKDCLSCLLTHLKLCKDFEVDNHIKDFAARLSLIPSPPPGPLHLVNETWHCAEFFCGVVKSAESNCFKLFPVSPMFNLLSRHCSVGVQRFLPTHLDRKKLDTRTGVWLRGS